MVKFESNVYRKSLLIESQGEGYTQLKIESIRLLQSENVKG